MFDSRLLEFTKNFALDYLNGLETRHAGALDSIEELRDRIYENLPQKGDDPLKIIREMTARFDGGIVGSAGPRYFGFVTGGAVPASLCADWLTSVWDQNGVLSVSSPAAGVVEEVVSSWILELLGLSSEYSVGFVTGCQMANFTCLAAARHEVLRRSGWDVEKKGLFNAPKVNVIIGEEAHATLINALKMLGFGTEGILTVPADGQGRINITEFEKLLKTCHGPLIVSAQAGNVNTGAFDPFEEITGLTREKNGWVHVDGAFGLWAKVVPALQDHLKGVERADSWATDAHKWLNVPYDSGLAIVANAAAHRASMALRAPYYISAPDEVRDPSQWVPESSRRARGFALYGAIKSLGREGIQEIVSRNCRQARLMASLLAVDPKIEILNEVVLNQVLVRFVPPEGEDQDSFSAEVIYRVQKDGTCWAGSSRWKGISSMRISVSNWMTTDDDIRISAEAIRKVLSEMTR